ncbi:hypothetical protein N9524_00985 [Flavobacteriaceae bacterium]|nr:hypothetical protein [Flavobacteriaceae bacterium]MDB4108417.1 hypothetical protein [Flavobacteriaceae bacterium]MDB4182993.1 hypothetical protein [Flavobacteriaceae bacterium]
MRSVLILLFSCSFFLSCDDGDVLNVEFDFDQDLTLCEINTNSYILYDTKEDPFESLTLLFPKNATNMAIFKPTTPEEITEMSLNGSSVRFNYRTYTGDPTDYICQVIPDATVSVNQDYEAKSGTIIFTSTFEDDDNDGVPNALEYDGDSDGDGIDDYIDNDDDGDNVLTLNENPDPNGDGDLSDAQDTDGDGTPDYLDDNDDGDATPTRLEDENNNGNLFDDISPGETKNKKARYLDRNYEDAYVVTVVNANKFERTYSINISLEDIDLTLLATDNFFFGTYEYTETLEGGLD